jgi:hypothetical protein
MPGAEGDRSGPQDAPGADLDLLAGGGYLPKERGDRGAPADLRSAAAGEFLALWALRI